MSGVYNEVTRFFSRDRVLEKLQTPDTSLPYDLSKIKVSHNDYLVVNVYNDAIRKLYYNWLYLIANSEIHYNLPSFLDVSEITFDGDISPTFRFRDFNSFPSGTTYYGSEDLSNSKEIYVTRSYNPEGDSESLIFLDYNDNYNLIYTLPLNYRDDLGGEEDTTQYRNDTLTNAVSPILSSNNVEYSNDSFKYENVVSVDASSTFLFVLDKGNNTLFKYDISRLIYDDAFVVRDNLTEKGNPGKVLLKTLGGVTQNIKKNKLDNPEGISIYGNRIYILDNGSNSIKIFDLDFNYIDSRFDRDLFLKGSDTPISIDVSLESGISSLPVVFILTKSGRIIVYDYDLKNKVIYNPFGLYSSKLNVEHNEQNNFKKIIASKTDSNVIYVITNRNIIKFYKTNLITPFSFYSISLEDTEVINSVDIVLVNQDSRNWDNIIVNTTFNDNGDIKSKTSIYRDRTNHTKLYYDTFYTNYFNLNNILVKPQELVNAITINKVVEKIHYNHSTFLQSICKRIYAKYNSLRVPEIESIIGYTFDTPEEFEVNNDFYIGLNEPLITDIINRPISKLYDQQKRLFDLIKESYLNTNPPFDVPEIIPSELNE